MLLSSEILKGWSVALLVHWEEQQHPPWLSTTSNTQNKQQMVMRATLPWLISIALKWACSVSYNEVILFCRLSAQWKVASCETQRKQKVMKGCCWRLYMYGWTPISGKANFLFFFAATTHRIKTTKQQSYASFLCLTAERYLFHTLHKHPPLAKLAWVWRQTRFKGSLLEIMLSGHGILGLWPHNLNASQLP